MKRTLLQTILLGAMMLLATNVSASTVWKQVYKVDYSDYTSYPFYVLSGFTPQWVDGVMVDQGSTGWHQYFLADNIPTEVGGSYTVKAMVKASEEVTFNVNLGWGWNEGEQAPKDVTVGTEWQEVKWDYDNVGGTSCNLVAQPSKGGVTIEWKYLEVGYEETAYTVAGTEALTGYSWDETKNRMKYSSDTGLYTWVANGIAVKSDSDLAFKIVKDGNWATSWPESNWVINTDVTGGKGIFTITITFNAETKDISVTPVKTEDIVDSWTDIIVNGDMEGDNNECFYVTEQGIGGPFLANLTEGIGVDGSRGVRVESYDNPANDWASSFFIRLPYQLLPESKYRISFDYKADKEGDFDTQSHTEPGGYIHYACVGSGTFTTEWRHYEAEGTITSDMSKEGKIFQTIAFNLAKNKVATQFIFDNVKFEIPTELLATLTKNPAVNPQPYTRPVFNSMAIVGDFLMGDDNWEPANGWAMTQDAENPAVWTLTKVFQAEAKTYKYKAFANGTDDYVLPDNGIAAEINFDTPNLGAGNYSLEFTVDTRKNELDLNVKKLDLTTYTATFTTDANWANVYAYAWSGNYPNETKFLGEWPGTKLEAVNGVYTVSFEATDAPEYIIFNNGKGGEGNQTADLEFINGGAYEFKAASGEEDPVKVAPEGWTNAINNGNLAGDDVSNFIMKEYPSTDIVPATIKAGAGTNGSRGILVKTADETEYPQWASWDSQFFVVMPQFLPEGTRIHVEFDYKASEDAKAETQSHGVPGDYHHWAAIGDVNFTTEWKHFSTSIEVDATMAKGDNGKGDGKGLKSICFNLAVNKHAVDYRFDNFGVWYQLPEVTTDPEVYTEFVEETGTLTYYYDGKKDSRTGVTEVYDPINYPDAVRFADYYYKVTKAVIDPSMKDAGLTSMRKMFYGGFNPETFEMCTLDYMATIEGLENLNTSIVTDMSLMFNGCQSLTSLNLNSFNTSNVTTMKEMFSGCLILTTIYCQDDWSTGTALSDNMFMGCDNLVGGEGTTFDSSVIDATYARPDGGTEAPGYFTDYIKGDANGDGVVDVADVVAIVNYILEKPGDNFNQAAADVNGDNEIDAADVVGVVNIILGKGSVDASRAKAVLKENGFIF